jgi:hypothetical protein
MRSNIPSPTAKCQGKIQKKDFESLIEDIPYNVKNRFPYKFHVAFLFGRGGNLLACSTNRIGTRSRGAGFSENSIHAERAVLKAVHNKDLRGGKLVVLRINRSGELRNSQPCEECKRHLEKVMRIHGLSRVYYSV